MHNRNGHAPKTLLKSKTAGYRPSAGYGPTWTRFGKNEFSVEVVESMMMDSQVTIGTMMFLAPLYTGEIELAAKSQEVGQYIAQTVETIQSNFDRVLTYIPWGRNGFEMLYELEGRKRYTLRGVKDFHPLDLRALSWQSSGELAGFRLRNLRSKMIHKGQVDLLAPYGLWLTHMPKYGSLYGNSAYRAAYWPWLEKVMKDGAEDILRMYMFKHAYTGGVMRFPMNDWTDHEGVKRSSKDMAQHMMEVAKTGALWCLPSAKDADKNYEWDFQPAKMGENNQNMIDYLDHLNLNILRGMGLPDDVVDQPDGGGTYGGRRIGWEAFLAHMQNVWNYLIRAIDDQVIKPLVALNFGPNERYSLKAKSLLETQREQASAQKGDEGGGQGADGGQPGGQGAAGVPLGSPSADPSAGGDSQKPGIGPKGGRYEIGPDGRKKYMRGQGMGAARQMGFNPSEARDAGGQWTAGGATKKAGRTREERKKLRAEYRSEHESAGEKSERFLADARKALSSVEGGLAKFLPKVEKVLNYGFRKGRQMAEAVAKERGLPTGQAEKVGRIVAIADQVLAWTTTLPVVMAVTGSLEAGKAASILPLASMGYVAYSTARNPAATLRAAQKLMSGAKDAKRPAAR